MLLDLTLIALCRTAQWHYQGAVHFSVAMYLSFFFSLTTSLMSAPLSAVKVFCLRKERRKSLKISAGRRAEECKGGRRRGGNMYGVGKILPALRVFEFAESDSGLFIVELYIMHPVSSSSLLKTSN